MFRDWIRTLRLEAIVGHLLLFLYIYTLFIHLLFLLENGPVTVQTRPEFNEAGLQLRKLGSVWG